MSIGLGMRQYRKWWHSKRDLKAHLVRCPKYRKKILYWELRERLRDIIKLICSQNDVKIITWKLALDHVHLFVSYPQTLCVSDMLQNIKWASSYKIMKENPRIREKYYRWWSFRARGYLAVSSGSITDEMIRDYIDNQEWEPIQWDIELE